MSFRPWRQKDAYGEALRELSEFGEFVLEGTVADRSSRRRAEDLVDRCGGVRDVHNRPRIAR